MIIENKSSEIVYVIREGYEDLPVKTGQRCCVDSDYAALPKFRTGRGEVEARCVWGLDGLEWVSFHDLPKVITEEPTPLR